MQRGFDPQSRSDQFRERWAWGPQHALFALLPFYLPLLPLSLFFVGPQSPTTLALAGQRLFSLHFVLVFLQGQLGAEGSPGAKGYPGRQVQYMAFGSSVAVVEMPWVPQAEGGRGLRPRNCTLRKGLFGGQDQGSLSLQG